jgi:hypothetical protein
MCREAWRGISKDAWDCARGFGQEIEPGERWSKTKTVAFYKQTLSKAGRIAQRSVSSGFEDARRKTWAEFAGFLQKVGMGLTVETARGIDIIAFIHGEWISSHRNDSRGKRRESCLSVSHQRCDWSFSEELFYDRPEKHGESCQKRIGPQLS